MNVDTLGYCDGQLVPFSVNEGLTLGPQHASGVPGLLEALRGKAVGTTVLVHLVIPPEHPVPHTYGANPSSSPFASTEPASCWPRHSTARTFWRTRSGAAPIEVVLKTLAEEWLDAETYRARARALQQVLETLAARAHITVGPELVDLELGRRWRRAEGRLLGRLNRPMAEQEQALAGWLDNAEMRREVEQTLRAGLVLRAVGPEKLTDAEGLRHTMDDLLNGLGVDPERVRRAFRAAADADTNARAVDAMIYLRASEFVWTKVKQINP